MTTMTFKQCCEAFGLLSSAYLEKKNKSFGCLSLFFYSDREVVKIVKEIETMSGRVTAAMNFPFLPSYQKNDFLEECVPLYKKLTHYLANHKASDFKSFYESYCFILKNMFVAICGSFKDINTVNLNYLDYYLDYFSCGIDTPSNAAILREEILGILSCYIRNNPSSKLFNLVKTMHEIIYADHKSINLHAHTDHDKVVNQINLLCSFMMVANDRGETSLATEVRNILNRSFGSVSQSSMTKILSSMS